MSAGVKLNPERAKDRAGRPQRLDEAVACGDFPGLAGRAGPCVPAARQARTVPRTVLVRARLLGLVARRVTCYALRAPLKQTRRVSSRGALRALATSPAMLGDSYARRGRPARAFAAPEVTPLEESTCARRDRGYPAGAISGSASSAGSGSARTQCVLRELTRTYCLSVARSAQRVMCASPGRAVQRSRRCKRRPTQHERRAGTPWRDPNGQRGAEC